MLNFKDVRIIGIAGQAGAGKDSLYEAILKPRGYLRWQMTLHYKTWLAATHRASRIEIFQTKPKHVRKILQEEITHLRYEHTEYIWLDVFKEWMRSLHEIVGVNVTHVAVTDVRFLIEMRGLKDLGGKILHIEAADQQANVAPELRGHRSEIELNSPEMPRIRDAHLINHKLSMEDYAEQGERILNEWGWS